MPRLTADGLVKKGRQLSEQGHLVVFLYPSQEWMAVQLQVPFLRYGRMPDGTMSRELFRPFDKAQRVRENGIDDG